MTEIDVEIGVEHFADYVRSRVLTASLIETHDAVAAAVLAELESGHYYIILVNRQIALSLRQCALVEAFRHGHRTNIKLCRFIHNAAFLGFTIADGPEIEDDWHVFSALNFAEDLKITRNDRNLNSFTVTGAQSGNKTFTLTGTNYVFRNLTDQTKGVIAGENINIAVNYTGRAMHTYFYIDRNHDGVFDCLLGDNGIPTAASELMAYSCYNNKNSLGEAISAPGNVPVNAVPQFTLPADRCLSRTLQN